MLYERQKTIQTELDMRIPPGSKGEPQNKVRHIVFSQRIRGKSFDESVEIACKMVRQRHPDFALRILPPRQQS